MKTPILIATLLTISLGSCKKKAAPQKEKKLSTINHKVKWERFRSKKGLYAVDFAGIKSATSKDQKTPKGNKIKVYTTYFNVNHDVFQVHWFEREEGVKGVPPRKELESRMRSAAKRMSAMLSRVKYFKLQGHDAIRAEITTPKSFKLMQMVLTPKRLYIVVAQLKTPKQNKENGEHFLESFKLTR